jgi:UDP:flavonoid glycosyltransferase YjiC (YdhE family)
VRARGQALAERTPIVGIPLNPHQYSAATAMCDAGAGVSLRASTIAPAKVRNAAERVIHDESLTKTAERAAASLARFDPHARCREVIDEVTADEATVNRTTRTTT